MNREILLIETENKCPIDIDNIIYHLKRFYSIMNIHQNIKNDTDLIDVVKDFQLATLEFSYSKNLIVNLLMPEENPYIKEAEENHHWLVDDLGRVDKRISEMQGKIGAKIEANIQLKKPNSFVELFSYYNYLLESANGLVFYPLLNVTKKFEKIKGEINFDSEKKLDLKQTKEKLFLYWVFLEMYHSSLSLGGITREEIQKRFPSGHTRNITIPNPFPTGPGIDQTTFSQVETSEIINPFEDFENV